ncbi:MAG: alpha/beta fold hydrolase [bacterium]|nr:alpha/beta fold hydrolase [bacterium]
MPLIENSNYAAPPMLRGKHLATILPSIFRSVPDAPYRRERMELDDGDFLDLDRVQITPDNHRLIILSHGLEGDSRGKYILGMVRAFTGAGWDALAWNFRGCSGEDNRLLRTYHGGASDDLARVVERALLYGQYSEIVLCGFSMGGNITLKYLGEQSTKIDKRIRAAVAFSVPCHFADCSQVLAHKSNRVYMWKFLKTLREKVRTKKARFPDEVDDTDLHLIKDFLGFDERFTAPTNGFRDAMDYWTSVSSRQFLNAIRVPALLVNAQNDPFLAPTCFPYDEARESPWLHFEAPEHGGHVGFAHFKNGTSRGKGLYWSEQRALAFVESALNAAAQSKTPSPGRRKPAAQKATKKAAKKAAKKTAMKKKSGAHKPAAKAAGRSAKAAAKKKTAKKSKQTGGARKKATRRA